MKSYNLIQKILVVLFLGLPHYLFANEVFFKVVQIGKQTPIENAHISWQFLRNNDKQGFSISDKKGSATTIIPMGERVIVHVSCIGYKTLVDTLLVKRVNQLYLEKDIFNLEQVVVIGSGKPTPIDSSLYKVRVIGKQRIQSSGATSLGDLFMTEPNVQITRDLVLGTRIEMLGLKGNNVKIMIDGVPIIGRLGGQIDLSQITLNNIDHIEIIEGPMSVVYGDNALAGTVNIIMQKNKTANTEVTASAGYENANRYDGGLHISQKIGKNTINIGGNYANFQGVDFDKSDRSMEWKPQRQYTVKASYSLNLKNWELNTKASLYNSKLTIKSDIHDYKVFDFYYFTDRYTGAVNLRGEWNESNHLSVLASHSFYNRASQKESKDLTTLESIKGKKESSQKEYNSLLRVIWHHQFSAESPLSVESGIDFNISSMEGKRIKAKKQNLSDYAAFINLRYSPLKNFEIQPGMRYSYNTDYDAPLLYSLNAKWNITKNLAWRASVAKGFRAPTVKELYMLFLNNNHEIYGNEELKAEKSNNISTNIDYSLKWDENYLKLTAQLYYNNIKNLITLIEQQTGSGYQYNNVDKYKTQGGSLGFSFHHKDWLRLNTSGILTRRYNNIADKSNLEDFNASLNWIVGLQIKEKKTKITFNGDFKHYGEQSYFYYDKNDNIAEGKRTAFQIANASLGRSFLKNRLQITVGAKNLTNVKSIKLTSSASGGGHSSNSSIAYGISYFIKANFKITK